MNSKEFNKDLKQTCISFGFNEVEENKYIGGTPFGKLMVISSPSPRIKLYTVFMRFLEWDATKHLQLFKEIYSENDVPSNSGKWNLHLSDALNCLDITEDRLNNMQYLFNDIK